MLLTILKNSWYDSYGYDRRSYSLTYPTGHFLDVELTWSWFHAQAQL